MGQPQPQPRSHSRNQHTQRCSGGGAVAVAVAFLLGIELEKQGFGTPWDVTGQMFQGLGLKLKAFILTVRDPASHLYQKT